MSPPALVARLLVAYLLLLEAGLRALDQSALHGWWHDALSLGLVLVLAMPFARMFELGQDRCPHCGDQLDGLYRHHQNMDGTCRVVLR